MAKKKNERQMTVGELIKMLCKADWDSPVFFTDNEYIPNREIAPENPITGVSHVSSSKHGRYVEITSRDSD